MDEQQPKNQFVNSVRQLGVLLFIAIVGGVIWTGFDLWQSRNIVENNNTLLEDSELPTEAIIFMENTLVGENPMNYEIVSISQATNPAALFETEGDVQDGWCIEGTFNPSDTEPRRVSLVLVDGNWSVRQGSAALWREAGCVVPEATAEA